MRTIAISKFKATCLAELERVRRSGERLLVTKRGEPIAEVVPPSGPASGKRKLGEGVGTASIVGDIVSPVLDEREVDALGDG